MSNRQINKQLRKEAKQSSQQNKNVQDSNLLDNTSDTKSKENLGYVDGYGEYVSKSGEHFGPGLQNKKLVKKISGNENKYAGTNRFGMFDNQSDVFKQNLNTYITIGFNKNSVDQFQDPTYLVFDIKIDYDNSPLFTTNNNIKNIENFINEYSSNIPEIGNDNRLDLYYKFKLEVEKIFPSNLPEINKDKSYKEHYIESISGLDVLTKKIINYPEDKIIFTISEDVVMSTQYLTELYNNLVYSYDTHRVLIPENLLRFDMSLIISDYRNMKTDDNMMNSIPSKMIYILHDCQFDFFESKNFESEIIRGGYNAQKPNISKSNFKINFKSYSKVMMRDHIIGNSDILDFRKRLPEHDIYFEYFDDTIPGVVSPIGEQDNTKKSKLLSYLRNETRQIRGVIVNKLKNEVTELADKAQNWLNEKVGVTLTDVNVYYDKAGDKVRMVDKFVSDFIDKKLDDIKGNKKNKNNNVDPIKSRNQWRDNYTNAYDEEGRTRNRDIENDDILNIGDDIDQNDAQYNQKFPDGDIHEDGQYNQKFPEGDVHEDGQYNQKFPNGDVHEDGIYNQKYPDGDVHEDGQYNQKFPEGDVHEDGQYNQKFPEGDVHEDGQYNQKFPEGDVHEDGQYNQKFPEGDLQEDGTYNQKFPNTNKKEDNKYNRKYPDGNVYDENN
ncbi:hypothetical protein [Trichloromonas sp.]|uniref:hypothetical protein n=1 Tax=Trichloromonas sp. TaxID=3069249 RepID=UPI002A4C8AAC|nr:hypothetical protein [Trichloromonas sp.]